MCHYYQTPATVDVARYFINGKKNFYTIQDTIDGSLIFCFLATEAYVEKMKARPFLKNITITVKA